MTNVQRTAIRQMSTEKRAFMGMRWALAAFAMTGWLPAATAEDLVVRKGEAFVFDLSKAELVEKYNTTDSTITIEDGGTVTNISQCMWIGQPNQPHEFKCAFVLNGEGATLALANWHSFKTLAGKISGNGLIRCVSGFNALDWAQRPHTFIVGDLSGFTGTLELDDMPVAVAGSSAKVSLARVKSRFNGKPCVGGGLELGANQRLSIGNLDGQLWVRSVDGSGSLDIKDSADSSQVIAVGAVGIRATGSDSPLARLTVTNDAAVTLFGGGFACVEGASGLVRVAEAVSHVYRSSSDVQFDVLSGGTLEFGNAEALAAANPALWLDAAQETTVVPFVLNGKEVVYTNNSTVVRRWNDRRATQASLYGINPFMKSESGTGMPLAFPYRLKDACNGLPVMSFGAEGAQIDRKWAQTNADGTPIDDGTKMSENRRLPFNKPLAVTWAVMVYGSQNTATPNGGMYLGGYVPTNDAFGKAGNYQAVFEDGEADAWSDDAVSYDGRFGENYFFRGWSNVGNRILGMKRPVWLDGLSVAAPDSESLKPGYQILTIDARRSDEAGTAVRAIGTKGDDGYNCGGQVYGELMLFTNGLSRVQRLAAEAYLAQKWRVPGYDLAVGNVSVEEGGVFRASELCPHGVGLNSDLTYDFRKGAIANPTVVGGELDAYLPGAITVDFGTERPRAGRYRLIAAGKINRLDPAKWTLKTIPETIKGRTVRLAWETNAAGDCTGAHMDIVSDGFAIMIR